MINLSRSKCWGYTHGERLADIVLEKQEYTDSLIMDNIDKNISYDIQVHDLSFNYTDDEPNIIDNLSYISKMANPSPPQV